MAARFALTALAAPEDDVQAAIVKALDVLLLPPATFTAIAATGYSALSGAQAAKFVRMGVRPGFSDLMVLGEGGKILFLEIKAAGGKLSKTRTVRTKKGRAREIVGQTENFARLEAMGFTVRVARTVEQALDHCRDAGIGLRAHGSVKPSDPAPALRPGAELQPVRPADPRGPNRVDRSSGASL